MSAADSFIYFHALPTELRLQIWGEALAVRSVWAAVRNYSADRDLSASRLPFIMVYIGPAPYLAGLSFREARRLLEQSCECAIDRQILPDAAALFGYCDIYNCFRWCRQKSDRLQLTMGNGGLSHFSVYHIHSSRRRMPPVIKPDGA